jgi:hypothetical protein
MVKQRKKQTKKEGFSRPIAELDVVSKETFLPMPLTESRSSFPQPEKANV